jgi:hypothetical protein
MSALVAGTGDTLADAQKTSAVSWKTKDIKTIKIKENDF